MILYSRTMWGRLKQRTGWFATTPHPAVAYRVDETSRQLNEANSTEESRKPTRFDSFLSSNSSHRQATSALKIQPKKKSKKSQPCNENRKDPRCISTSEMSIRPIYPMRAREKAIDQSASPDLTSHQLLFSTSHQIHSRPTLSNRLYLLSAVL